MKILIALAPLALLGACGMEPDEPANTAWANNGPMNPDCELAKNALKGSQEYKNRKAEEARPGATPEPVIDPNALTRCRLNGAGAFLATAAKEQWYFLPRTDNIFSFDPRMIWISDNGTANWVSEGTGAAADAKRVAELQRLFAASKEIK